MLDKFWDKIGEDIAEQWNIKTFSMSLLFWGIGLFLFLSQIGWKQSKDLFDVLGINPIIGGVILISLLIIVIAFEKFVEWCARPFLKFLEGYWPNIIRERMMVFELIRHSKLKDKFTELSCKNEKSLMDEQEIAQVEYNLYYQFPEESAILPTGIGNILKSAEEYPLKMYGLESVITWPHLWLVLPENTRQELGIARQQLYESIQLILWGILFGIWVVFTWWAPVIGILIAFAGLYRAQSDAATFGVLFRSVYDLYRFDLFKSLHWKMARKSDQEYEKSIGLELTNHILRHNINNFYDHQK